MLYAFAVLQMAIAAGLVLSALLEADEEEEDDAAAE
jgi:hypothetical protein